MKKTGMKKKMLIWKQDGKESVPMDAYFLPFVKSRRRLLSHKRKGMEHTEAMTGLGKESDFADSF